MDHLLLNNLPLVKRQATPISGQCKVCAGSATYSYFGVISCNPCKMFFKRNAERGLEALKCHFDRVCKTNRNNRYECSYCRLVQCFASGMQIAMIRPSHPTPRKKRKHSSDPVQKTSTALVRLNEPKRFPTLNLLQADISTLTVEQWNLISNLSHCYDEHSRLLKGEHYMREQDILPHKLRFKTASMIIFIDTIVKGAQLLYKNNRDFLSLTTSDRSILIHSTTAHTASVSGNFIFFKIGLMNCSAYYTALEIITHPSLIPTAKRIASRLDFDLIVIKLLLAILSFSTITYTVYSNAPPVNLTNIKQILHIQDAYIELLWRYLLYKYNHHQAVRCFSDIIRCLFAIDQAMVEIEKIQWFTNMMDSCVQQTEETLTFNDQ